MSDMDKPIEIKPTTFARGVPKEDHNGFYGDGEAERLLKMLDEAPDQKITAIVTYSLDDVTRKGKGVRYPVLVTEHIEPIWDEFAITETKSLQRDAHKERTGKDELDFSAIEEAGER